MTEKKRITKTLATCSPTEFLVQANKIRKVAAKWLEETEILNIRKRPVEGIADNMGDDERKTAVAKQVKKNISDMLDAALEKYPKDTLELLAMVCFVEPDEIDDYPIMEYLNAVTTVIGDEAVLSFFTSLARLANNGFFS